MNRNNPIGIFDSGIGGTSIWTAINNYLPNENTIYLADSKNAPYGEKSKQEIIDFSIKNTVFLMERNCKAIVVACNTATTNAISVLRTQFPQIPFIGIEPAIKPAAIKTLTKNIGILATRGTLSSDLFCKTSGSISKDIHIHVQNGEGLVSLIESGRLKSPETLTLLKKYLSPMMAQNIDCLVLGCTHYPYLIPQIKLIVGEKVTLIDSGFAVAKQLERILIAHNLLNNNALIASHQFYCNADIKVLKTILKEVKDAKIDFFNF
ncbi:MAG: glutamate racemase [Flavobacteriales bacterium CG_4_9_14_0_2_um_filter_35_242]|nr:MAG: glutamate racemase [Flavobacteriaceae bacterium CG1_02_35_72]PIR14233.1 MAG: glutamate racemase [Flavobacteriales bacterium CG11_big_fil_rev_8_21_14_0_20_35_7]PJC58638.1 MAG: glutamate racemase [Flavobacteriales bacterium CG_4_9_14_0_2_um_filter_35_242]